jgi:hypothetical protein
LRAGSEVRLVEAWHEALNSKDADLLASLCSPDVEVGGPRGSGRGADVLREWVARADVHLVTRRVYHRPGTVVAEQEARWRDAGTGETTGARTVASVFTLRNGRVAGVFRYDSLADALRAAGLAGPHGASAGGGGVA